MELNEQSTYLPYRLGRLFAVLEAVQQRANPNINTTIKDRYFNSACATPALGVPDAAASGTESPWQNRRRRGGLFTIR